MATSMTDSYTFCRFVEGGGTILMNSANAFARSSGGGLSSGVKQTSSGGLEKTSSAPRRYAGGAGRPALSHASDPMSPSSPPKGLRSHRPRMTTSHFDGHHHQDAAAAAGAAAIAALMREKNLAGLNKAAKMIQDRFR